MDLILLYLIARLFKLDKRRLFLHYVPVAVLGGLAYYMTLQGREPLAGALVDTAVFLYVIFIGRIVMGKYSPPVVEES